MKKILAENIWSDILKIRDKSPLVHNITNYVAMNNTANALLSIGASPVMAHAEEEVEDMVNIADVLVINIGTLSKKWIIAMEKAMLQAKKKNKPIILDPVGAGATIYRNKTIQQLLSKVLPSVIRGNASEIKSMVLEDAKTKGVDSIDTSDSAVEAAQYLCKTYNCVVSVSGKTDFVLDKNNIVKIYNGANIMSKVTAMGCTASALTGAFAAINSSAFQASINAMIVMGIAGEIAAKQSKGPGTLQINFLDTLYNIKKTDIKKYLKAEYVENKNVILSN